MSSQGKRDRRRPTVDRRSFLAAASVAGAGLLAGCLGDDGEEGPITIGAIQPFSGPFAAWGEAHSKGLNFAVDEINADGGVLGGRELDVVEADTGSDPVEADSIFRQQVEQDGAVAVTGAVSSDVGVGVAPTAEELQVPNILHMAGSSAIITRDTRYTFRVGSHSSVTDTLAVVGLIEEHGFSTVGAIMADYEWGRSFEAAFTELLPDGVDLTYGVAPVGESNFSTYLRDLPDDVEMVAATGHPPGQISIHNQAIELGLEPQFTTGAGFPPAVLAGGLGENAATFAHQHVADPYSDDFVDVATRFADENDERFDTHEAYGYIAATLVAEAIEIADSTEPAEIATAIRGNTFDTLLRNPLDYAEWGEVDNLIHMLSTFEFEPPEYFPGGDWRLSPAYQTEPLDAYDPSEWDF